MVESLFETILSTILAGRPRHAIFQLLNAYDIHDDDDLVRCHVFYCSVRHHVCSREEYRNPDYPSHLRSVGFNCDTNDADRIRLLGSLSLLKQTQVYKSRKPYLLDPYSDQALKSIPPYIPLLLDFQFPVDLLERVAIRKQEQEQEREQNIPSFTAHQIQQILASTQEMLMELHQPLQTAKDLTVAVVLLQIVTGRRFNEIASSMTLSMVPGYPFQASVTGLLKNFGATSSSVIIPLLSPFETVHRVFQLVRTRTRGQRYHNAHVSNITQDLFGFPLTHTLIRNIYLSLSYQQRHSNGFLPDSSRAYFDTRALGHCHNQTIPYQRLNL